MKFDTSSAAHEFIENIHTRVGARNQAILGRAALFLALGEGVPAEFKPKDSKGVTLNDEQVVGDDLKDVVRTALNHRAGKTLDEAGYRTHFRQHFEYGCMRLHQLWQEAGNDQTKFVASLLNIAEGDFGTGAIPGHSSDPMPVVDSAVKLRLLENADEWVINEAGHNGLLVISGRPGTGKSQLALDLLAQIARQGVRFVFFDLKGELEDDPSNPQQRETRRKFLDLTKAGHIRLIHQDLPINPLVFDPNPTIRAKDAYEIVSLIRAFAPQIGAKQERALTDAYSHLDKPDFVSLLTELESIGANGVEHALVQKIVTLNLFASADTAVNPEDWLKSSLVIDFKEFNNDNDTKGLAVALILNFLMKRLNRNLAVKKGIQPLKMVLFVDEAHLLLPKEGKAGLLSSLARQGRSWGFPVWLASQDADAFVTTGPHSTNFADLAGCGIHFSPDTLKDSEQREILGSVLNHSLKQGEAALRLHKKLQTGPARQFWRTFGSI
jgi:hypothetical protein